LYLRSTFAHADSGGFESPPLRKHKRWEVKVDEHGVCIKILELNKKEFRTLEKLEVDSWTSGLLKERKYSALNL
jgi:hypothetical protein